MSVMKIVNKWVCIANMPDVTEIWRVQ